MLKFKQFLKEGGNIKVGGVGANPINVTDKNRGHIASDIHHALSSLHDSFHNEHGGHLFGKNKKALENGSAFAGSTKHLMDKKISDKEYAKHKPTTSDIDVQIPHEHKEALTKHLTPGKKFGKYTVVGTKGHGHEVSAILKHENGQHHQIDFEATHYHKDEPHVGEQFLHSSNWEDTKKGIKGVHHKLLLNAAGGSKYKFSNTNGLKSRTDETDAGTKHPQEVTKKLFGHDADSSKIHSFTGVTDLIKKHYHPSHHQEIYDKFKDSLKKHKGIDHEPAINHLKNNLKVKDSINESEEEHHTTVVPMTGFSPFSHMGHAHDLGRKVMSLPGTKHVGISGKSDLYSGEERANILHRQWGGDKNVHAHVVKFAGETIKKAHDSLPAKGKKILHLVVGHDRRKMAEDLKSALEHNKLKEMKGHKFDEIHIHHPDDVNRSHGMSGTAMRTAAASGNLNTFHKHLGPMFTRAEAQKHMARIKKALSSNKLAVKRK